MLSLLFHVILYTLICYLLDRLGSSRPSVCPKSLLVAGLIVVSLSSSSSRNRTPRYDLVFFFICSELISWSGLFVFRELLRVCLQALTCMVVASSSNGQPPKIRWKTCGGGQLLTSLTVSLWLLKNHPRVSGLILHFESARTPIQAQQRIPDHRQC